MPRYSDKSGGTVSDNAAYHLVRRAQAKIAGRQHFGEGELCAIYERAAFSTVAEYCCGKYFPLSQGLEVGKLIHELYIHVLVMAPVLQGLPYSMKFDWHKGHILSWFRTNCNCHVGRFYYSATTIPRVFDAETLLGNMKQVGIHDTAYLEMLLEQYKCHYGGNYLRCHLAHSLFDPIQLLNAGEGFRLRLGNAIHSLEKKPFPGCVNLSEQSVKISDDYRIRFQRKRKDGGGHLEIILTHDATDRFKQAISAILGSTASPEHKLWAVNDRMRDFLEAAVWARSAWLQMKDLRNWLVAEIRPLYGNLQKPHHRNEMHFSSDFVEKRKDGLYLTAPNFFWNPSIIDVHRFITFMSPYREI